VVKYKSFLSLSFLGMIFRVEGVYVPDCLEEARRIVPGIDVDRFVKWRREGAVELVVEDVYRFVGNVAFSGVEVLFDRDGGSVAVRYPGGSVERVSIREYLGRLYCRVDPGSGDVFRLFPGSLYVVVTEEVVVPCDLLPFSVRFRSSFHRAGWVGKCANVDPGFRGRLHVLLYGPPGAPVLCIRRGVRAVQVRFLKLSSPVEGYCGVWKGT